MGGWHRHRERTNLCTTYLEDVSIATEAITTKMRGACTNPLTSPNCLASSLVEVRNRQLVASIHPSSKHQAGYHLLSSFSPSVITHSPPFTCAATKFFRYPACVLKAHSVALLQYHRAPDVRSSHQQRLGEPALYGHKGNPDLRSLSF